VNPQDFLRGGANRPDPDMHKRKADFSLLTIELPQSLTAQATLNPARYPQGRSSISTVSLPTGGLFIGSSPGLR